MKKMNILLLIVIGLINFSCNKVEHKGDFYYIYINGELGRKVQITYSESEKGEEFPSKNVKVSETVTLPFYKLVPRVAYSNEKPYSDAYLEIKTSNDSTTKAIIFSWTTKLQNSNCYIMQFFIPENAVGDCAYCKDLAKDSVMRYIEGSNYPCYIEFEKGDSTKRVQLIDWYNNNHK